jgi:hypothetical protein
MTLRKAVQRLPVVDQRGVISALSEFGRKVDMPAVQWRNANDCAIQVGSRISRRPR